MQNKCEYDHIAKAICNANQYEYIGFIDAGTFKETYHTQKNGNDYALKVFKPNNSSERASREIDAMKRMTCSHIAKLITVDTFTNCSDTFLYFFEEYLAGGTLSSLFESSPLPRSAIISIGANIIIALENTASQHVVHRDIKPDNIMFRKTGMDAVLVDFGLVRDLDASALTKEFFARGPGTPLYSAPEQLNNEISLIDWRTDQFALGITLCMALFKTHPFHADTPVQIVEKIASKAKCNSDIHDKLVKLKLSPLIKMIEPYPINRYRTTCQLKADWNLLEA